MERSRPPAVAPGFIAPRPLEVAWGWLPGFEPAASDRAVEGAGLSPLGALQDVLVEALRVPPCFVSFSGGRDSTVVLAAATDAARRDGLALPIPLTMFFRGASADETAWQEEVVRHLRLPAWIRLEATQDMDLLGPLTQPGLVAHGMVWPPTAHARERLIDAAHGGTLLTGNGGDELFGPHRMAPVSRLVRGGWRRGPRRLVVAAGRELLGPRARTAGLDRRVAERRPWLRAESRTLLTDVLRREASQQPLRWDRSVLRVPDRRSWRVGAHNLAMIAARSQVDYGHPLLDTRVVAALARHGGWSGPAGRTAALQDWFGDVVPAIALRRTDKARFNQLAFGHHTREFVRAWDGSGVLDELVDPQRLHEEWLRPVPSASTFMLLQQAWLASARRAGVASSRSAEGQLAPRGADREVGVEEVPVCAALGHVAQ